MCIEKGKNIKIVNVNNVESCILSCLGAEPALIPRRFHHFYKDLPVSAKARDRVAEPAADESDYDTD